MFDSTAGLDQIGPPKTCEQSAVSRDGGCVIFKISLIPAYRTLITSLGGSNLAQPSCISAIAVIEYRHCFKIIKGFRSEMRPRQGL